MEATYSGTYVGEGGGEGMPFTVPFITIFELDGDKIRRNADYFDLVSLNAQIAPPAEEGAATPAA
jgi:hypothetical protein